MFGFGKNKIAAGDKLFGKALASYEAGVKDLDEQNAAGLKAAEELEKAAVALREKVTIEVANRETEKSRVMTAMKNIRALIGIAEPSASLEEK